MKEYMKLRIGLFGYHRRDVNSYLKSLQAERDYLKQYYAYRLKNKNAELSRLLEEEERLWEEMMQVHTRLAKNSTHNGMQHSVEAEMEQMVHRHHHDESSPAAGLAPLGEMLVQKGLISEKQLADALVFQREKGGRLGDILVDFHYSERETIDAVLDEQNHSMKLGEWLVYHDWITSEQLQEALQFQQRSGGKLGEILTALKWIEPKILYNYIAKQYQMGRVGNGKYEEHLPRLPESVARTYQCAVVGQHNHRCLLAVATPLPNEVVQHVEQLLSQSMEQVLATPEEMRMYWNAIYSDEQLEISTTSLLQDQPENSASVTFIGWQKVFGWIALIGSVVFLLWKPFFTLLVMNIGIQFFYFFMTCFKAYILFKGADEHTQMRLTKEETEALDERTLPVYTILIPMYKEANILPQLIKHVEALDYPKFKLDVRILLEEDDVEAIETIQKMKLPSYYTMIVVPHSLPKTKPKACNYGLIHARGDYVVIYDAEDRPESDQLKKVIAAFRKLPDDVVCVQAKLNYFNSDQNWLTRFFTQEYSMWFELLLPGVMKLDVPIPLGGTSNHFKIDPLKRLQAWDPYNVTEDADLGVRLYKQNYKTAIIDSRTWEEANSELGNWIRQRSRWIKGYMQTWLVHMRYPLRLWKELGTKGFFGFQAMVLGTPLLPLLNPLFWLLLLLWYGWEVQLIPKFFPGGMYYFSAILFYVGNFLFIMSHAVGTHWVVRDMRRKGKTMFSFRLTKFALLTPLYWGITSIAAIKALWQLLRKPFYWEKTRHGLVQNTINHER